MKGSDELHLEPVFLFKLFLTFTFSCLFSSWLYGFLGYSVKWPLPTEEIQKQQYVLKVAKGRKGKRISGKKPSESDLKSRVIKKVTCGKL